MVDTYFYHRSEFKGCMYEKQTYSKSNRKLDRQFSKLLAPDSVYERIYSKHFKKQYNEKPTCLPHLMMLFNDQFAEYLKDTSHTPMILFAMSYVRVMLIIIGLRNVGFSYFRPQCAKSNNLMVNKMRFFLIFLL